MVKNIALWVYCRCIQDHINNHIIKESQIFMLIECRVLYCRVAAKIETIHSCKAKIYRSRQNLQRQALHNQSIRIIKYIRKFKNYTIKRSYSQYATRYYCGKEIGGAQKRHTKEVLLPSVCGL